MLDARRQRLLIHQQFTGDSANSIVVAKVSAVEVTIRQRIRPLLEGRHGELGRTRGG
jgi:hypothetical protein